MKKIIIKDADWDKIVVANDADKLPLFNDIFQQMATSLYEKASYHIIDFGTKNQYGDIALIGYQYIYNNDKLPSIKILFIEDNKYQRQEFDDLIPALDCTVPPMGMACFYGLVKGLVSYIYNRGHNYYPQYEYIEDDK